MASEYFDTGNDPRILFAINTLSKTLNMLRSRETGIIKRLAFRKELEEILKLLNRIRYFYLPKQELIQQEYFRKLEEKAQKLYHTLMGNYDEVKKISENLAKWLRFVLRNLLSLKERLISYPDDPASAVQRCFVNILSITKHPRADKLRVALVTDGSEKFEIITNDPSVKAGEVVLLAFLPPKEFHGVVSEGMFLGPDGIRKGSAENVGESPTISEEESRKILSEIYSFIKPSY
ncbi:MAG: hypothetical protein ACTSX9_02625 [Candidatus Njordarchaeales archaeon]